MTVDILQYLEQKAQWKLYIAVAVVSAIGTALVWWVHLERPGTFPDPFVDGQINVARMILTLGPPFLIVFCIGNAILGQGSRPETAGPMAGYLRQQESQRRWKVTLAAGIASAANFLVMMVTA